MDEILEGFCEESKELTSQMMTILEEVEENLDQNPKLEKFGQLVDRIMGTAKTLAKDVPGSTMRDIGNYCELCKLIGYKASQLQGQKEFCNIVVAFLLDATEMLDEMIDDISSGEVQTQKILTVAFLDRLKMISGRFDDQLRGTLASTPAASEKPAASKSTQSEIDSLLKKLGVGT